MKITYVGTPPFAADAWIREAIAQSTYDFDQLAVHVRIHFESTVGGSAQEFAEVDGSGNFADVFIRTDLADPSRPGTDGGAPPGYYTGKPFFQEVFIHELGHVIADTRFDVTVEDAICGLFNAPAGHWVTGDWKTSIAESAAETFKDLFTTAAHRKFKNRTSYILPPENVKEFVRYFTAKNPIAPYDNPPVGGVPGWSPGFLATPPPEEIRTDIEFTWQGVYTVTRNTLIPAMTDGGGTFHAEFEVTEVIDAGTVQQAEPVLSESYPGYYAYTDAEAAASGGVITALPPKDDVSHAETGFIVQGSPVSPAGRPRFGDPSYGVLNDGQPGPKVEASTGPLAIEDVDLGLPAHDSRRIIAAPTGPTDTGAELAPDGNPKSYGALMTGWLNYPRGILHPDETPTMQGTGSAPGDQGYADENANPWTAPPYTLFFGGARDALEDGNPMHRYVSHLNPHPAFGWPTTRGGGAGGPDWIIEDDPDPLRFRLTVRGDWITSLFQSHEPAYPYEIPAVPDTSSGYISADAGWAGVIRFGGF